jgi:choline dehydrogenase-like flavoprotein
MPTKLDLTAVHNIYRPVGICKMGNAPMAVVNDRLQVPGIGGLHVAGALATPFIIKANTTNQGVAKSLKGQKDTLPYHLNSLQAGQDRYICRQSQGQ